MSNQELEAVNKFKELSAEEMGACVMWYLQAEIHCNKETIKECGLDRGTLEALQHLVEVYNYICDCTAHDDQAYKYGDII